MMPEAERETIDVDDFIPWDFDNDTMSEADVQDLISNDDDESDDDC